MNAAANHAAAFIHRAERIHDQPTHGREEDGGVKAFGGALIGVASPDRAEFAREQLGFVVARAGEGVNFAALVARNLCDDMRRRAESEKADTFCVAGLEQRTITNQSGAQQRRRLGVRIEIGEQETKSVVCQREFGIAAIQCIAGEPRLAA